MRDKRFIAAHRGGPLSKEQHRQLMQWACACVQHVLPLAGNPDKCLADALATGNAWIEGNASVGDARNASLQAIAAAREATEPVAIAITRAAGHAVATAHMADHALGAALYALKAIKLSGRSVDTERAWQDQQLPASIRELAISGREQKEQLSNFK